MDAHGEPISGAEIRVNLVHADGIMGVDSFWTNRRGEFRILGFPGPYQFEFMVETRIAGIHGFTPIRAGESLIRVEEEGARMAWIDAGAIRIEDLAELGGIYNHALGASGSFDYLNRSFDPGPLELFDRFTHERLAVLEDFDPARGEDSRLHPWDLRGRIHGVRLVWNRADPIPPDWSLAIVPPVEDRGREWNTNDRAVEFLTTRNRLDLWIHAYGFRSQLFKDVAKELEVVLEPGIPVSFQLENLRLLTLAPWVGVSMHCSENQNLDRSFLDFEFDAQGMARCPLPAAGSYLVYLMWSEEYGPHYSNTLCTSYPFEEEILVGEDGLPSAIRVTADFDAVQKEIEAARK